MLGQVFIHSLVLVYLSCINSNIFQQEHGIAAQQPLLKPVTDLWFENSKMVVLRAGTKEFRVPQCILISQSRVFREFLKLDNSTFSSAANIQHYRISDPPDYAECFLRALFHSGFVPAFFFFRFEG